MGGELVSCEHRRGWLVGRGGEEVKEVTGRSTGKVFHVGSG